jgi:hypothetical protein
MATMMQFPAVLLLRKAIVTFPLFACPPLFCTKAGVTALAAPEIAIPTVVGRPVLSATGATRAPAPGARICATVPS